MKPVNDFSVEAAEDSPGFSLWQVTTLWQRGIKKELNNIGLTHPQFVLLASLLWLLKQKEVITQIDLSNHSKIDPMTTSTIIKTLLKKELIERIDHHFDTRAKKITFSDKGRNLTQEAIALIEKFDTAFFLPLEKETSTFNASLQHLLHFNK